MGTLVTIEILGADAGDDEIRAAERDEAIDRAFQWFHEVESACSRFDPSSELRQLSACAVGRAVPVSTLLYTALEFALAVAEDSNGALDPTIGAELEARGFARNYRDGLVVAPLVGADAAVSFRDVHLDPDARTVALARPLVLDLGAVAKGLAVDLAARELQPFTNFAIDAGGDLYLGGRNANGEAWSVGVRHPRIEGLTIATLRVSDLAVCTSGDYERRQPDDAAGHHILDPRGGAPAADVASVTVVARSAMLADALGTAAFVLGPADGLRWIEAHGVEGLIVSPSLERFATKGLRDAAILSNT
jgi:thiamine biosynthesis lipoprotein